MCDAYLEAISIGKKIGKTDSAEIIYEIKGQPGHDWIAFVSSSEMSITQIFHKKQIEPFSIYQKKIEEVSLVSNKGLKRVLGIAIASTKKPSII